MEIEAAAADLGIDNILLIKLARHMANAASTTPVRFNAFVNATLRLNNVLLNKVAAYIPGDPEAVYLDRNGASVAFVSGASALLPGTHAGGRTPGVAPLRRHSYFRNPNRNDWGLGPQVGTLVDRKDLEALCASIRNARENADIVVLSDHWGMVEDRIAIGDHKMFGETVGDIASISKAAGFFTCFERTADRLIVG